MIPITEIAQKLGIDQQMLIPYGKYKAKIHLDAIKNHHSRGKFILVTAMTPTSAGEGKTTTTIGLTQALGQLGLKATATLREPSLGPIFGIKGGATGGGLSQVVPEDEVNIHFTGDFHAIASAHNLLASFVDNIVYYNKIPSFTAAGITWRRVTDMQDRALRKIVSGVGDNTLLNETGFDIVAASEIMAIFALCSSVDDLRMRLSKIVIGFTSDNRPVTAEDVGAVGPMMSLLSYAIHPNLVQTLEGQPVLVHAGPFANIAHGCSSVLADKLALGYSDYVLTEAGFGADLGFEKFMHIKARSTKLEPDAVVLVTTVRAIKSHGGLPTEKLTEKDTTAINKGIINVLHLLRMIKSFNLPVAVTINRHPSDTDEEVNLVKSILKKSEGCNAIDSFVYAKGGNGGLELAQEVVQLTNEKKRPISYMYDMENSIEQKVQSLAANVYGAKDVKWSLTASKKMKIFSQYGWDKLPVCMAKTHLSISDKARLKGAPSDYVFEISDVRASVGAGFIYPIAGKVLTMPGLPETPRALDIDKDNKIVGLS